MAAAEREMLLDPNNLRADLEVRGHEPSRDFDRMHTGVPQIHNVTREQLIGSAPILLALPSPTSVQGKAIVHALGSC
jgi:hypothetical protein